jgi:iduronate 2-sulfatase
MPCPRLLPCLALLLLALAPAAADPRPNVLLIVADDLTKTALGSYGNRICQTPNLDRLAASGLRFTRAYCQGTYCGPSRASFLSGYYPHALNVFGYTAPRAALGERATWPQHFRQAGYHTARIGKIYHMGVPGGVEDLGPDRDYNGADDPASWTERWNTPGPEWRAPGTGETLERNPDGTKPVMGGNTFVVVEADGDDDEHHDGKAAAKAVDFLRTRRGRPEPFFLAVGFVRPHVPFVAPRKYFAPYLPYEKLPLPPKVPGDWDDLPKAGINYKTSVNMQLDERRQRKAIGGYYASVSFMDAQVGRVLAALEAAGLADNTIVIFTSDHGYHLGEHDFWAKVSLLEESAQVPLLVRVPGRKPGVRDALVELLDLFPTTAALCGLPVPARLQGRDLAPVLADPGAQVRDTAFSAAPSTKGFLLRDDRFAFIQYQEDASGGIELYDLAADPGQYTNLARRPEHAATVAGYRERLTTTLRAVRTNDLGR